MQLTVVKYQPEYQPFFELFNKAWLEEYFTVEALDKMVLDNPQEMIINPGGDILFAADELGEILGTVALRVLEPGVYELTKMAVKKDLRGKGAGQFLCQAAIDRAIELGANRLILYSNTILENAIFIYRKLGFKEIPLQNGVYGRANIMMEYILTVHPA